jgi:hypothetical protein
MKFDFLVFNIVLFKVGSIFSQGSSLYQLSLGICNTHNNAPLFFDQAHNRNYELIPSAKGHETLSPVLYTKGGVGLGCLVALERQMNNKWTLGFNFSTIYNKYKMVFNPLTANPAYNSPWVTSRAGFNTSGYSWFDRVHVLLTTGLGAKLKLKEFRHLTMYANAGIDVLADVAPLNAHYQRPQTEAGAPSNHTDLIIAGLNVWRRNIFQVQPNIGLSFNRALPNSKNLIGLNLKYSQIDFSKFYRSELVLFTAHNFVKIDNIEPNFGRVELSLSYKWR